MMRCACVTLAACLGCSPLAPAPTGPAQPESPTAQLPKRAAFDLSCSESALVLTDLGHDTAGVEGCGQKATYVFDVRHYQWFMNTINGTVRPAVVSDAKGTP